MKTRIHASTPTHLVDTYYADWLDAFDILRSNIVRLNDLRQRATTASQIDLVTEASILNRRSRKMFKHVLGGAFLDRKTRVIIRDEGESVNGFWNRCENTLPETFGISGSIEPASITSLPEDGLTPRTCVDTIVKWEPGIDTIIERASEGNSPSIKQSKEEGDGCETSG